MEGMKEGRKEGRKEWRKEGRKEENLWGINKEEKQWGIKKYKNFIENILKNLIFFLTCIITKGRASIIIKF